MKNLKYIIGIVLCLAVTNKSFAQLNPMGSVYYHNQYLANPAMAGITKGWELNGAYKAQWTNINGAPNMQVISAAHGSENSKVGFGLLLYNDKAGVVQTTSVKATYAYHLILDKNQTIIDFGLSGGIINEWLNRQQTIGDLSDESLTAFNERKLYVDADFGIALRAKNLTIQGALPNLKQYFSRDIKRNTVDKSTYFAALSYMFLNKEGKLTSIEPKLVYRGITNYKDIIDAGVNFQFNEDKLLLSGIYHSTNSITFGAGTTYNKKLTILAQYTTNTADLQGYSNGEFEVALKYNFR